MRTPAHRHLDTEFLLNLFDAVLIIGISLPTLVIAVKVKQPRLRLLTSLLTGFLIVHGVYHLTAAAGAVQGLDVLGQVSDLVIEPIGWLVFLVFAVFLVRYRM
jgi:hypothetical protein